MLDLISSFPCLLHFLLYFPFFNLLTLVLNDFFSLIVPMVTLFPVVSSLIVSALIKTLCQECYFNWNWENVLQDTLLEEGGQ